MAEITIKGDWDDESPVADLFAQMAAPQGFTFVMPGRWPIPNVLTFGALLTGAARTEGSFAEDGEGGGRVSMTLRPVGLVTRRCALLWRNRRVLAQWGHVPLEVPNG